jgi:hypothetical protein
MVVVRHRYFRRPSGPAARISRVTLRFPQLASWRRRARRTGIISGTGGRVHGHEKVPVRGI